MSFSEKILAYRIRRQMTHQAFADAVGVSRGAVQQWEKGVTAPKRSNQPAVAEFMGISVAQLMGQTNANSDSSHVEPVERRRRVPLISWITAGAWGEVRDQASESDEWADAYDTQPGEQAFALRVTGDSMTSPYPGDRSFPDGTIIIVDPARAADAGDYVVAKDVGTQKATFKRLAVDGGRWYLKPLNPTYLTLEIDDPAMRVIGKVIEYQTRGKL